MRAFLQLLLAASVAGAQLAAAGVPARGPKHIVVLMEENRSFDHMFFDSKLPVDVLRSTDPTPFSNPLNSTDPNSPRVVVNGNSPYVGKCDPNHSTTATTQKIYSKVGGAA